MNGFVHLDYLLEDVVLLLLFQDRHDGAAALDEVLLPLDFKGTHLFEMI